MVGGGWVVDGGSMAEHRQKKTPPPVCFMFHKNQPTNCAPRTTCIPLYVLLHGCSDVRTAALLFCCM